MKRNMFWVGVVSCVCSMGFFGLLILLVDKDFDIHVFCFVGFISIDMEKSIYGLGFNSLGRQRGWWAFVAIATT